MNPKVPGLQIKTILVPTDFSDPAHAAATFAVTLADRLGAELIFLHVANPYLGSGDLLLDVARLQVDTEYGALEQLTDWAKGIAPAAKLEVRIGVPAHQIIEAARELKADLIVIPTHGRSAIAQFFMGGVAEKVVRHAGCPVLVLPWTKRFEPAAVSTTRNMIRTALEAI